MLTTLAGAAANTPAPSSPLEIWLRFAGTIAAIVATGVGGWWATRKRLDQQTEEVKKAGEPAAVLAEPLGAEGLTFTQSVLSSLAELKQGQIEQGQRLARHLEDHASSDLRRPHRV